MCYIMAIISVMCNFVLILVSQLGSYILWPKVPFLVNARIDVLILDKALFIGLKFIHEIKSNFKLNWPTTLSNRLT